MARIRRKLARFVPQDWWTGAFVLGTAVAIVAVAALVRSVPTRDPSVSAEPVDRAGPSGRPAAMSGPGELVSSEVRAGGSIRVTHWVRTRVPVSRIAVTVPGRPLPAGPAHARSVEVEDPAGAVLATTGRVGIEPRTMALSRPVRAFRLTYELTGVVDRSASVTGRALAGITFLDVDFPHRRGPTEVTVTGWRVLNLGCLAVPAEPAPRPCGAPDGAGWAVTLPPRERDGNVTAQLDLGQVSWADAR